MNVAFKNCTPFAKFITLINNEHVDTAESIGITRPICNLIEYNDNYSDTSGSLWQFKRDESVINNAGNPSDVTTNNLASFKYKLSIFGTPAADGVLKKCKNSCSVKISMQFLAIIRNAFD